MNVDLQPNLGLPIRISAGELEFADKFVRVVRTKVFKLNDMRGYFLNPLSLFPRNVYEQYFVEDTQGALRNINIGLQVYKVNPQLIGIEYAKTRGCMLNEFPRVMEINYGRVIVVLQRHRSHAKSQPDDVMVAKLSARDKLVVPPHFGVTVVNNTPRPAVFTFLCHANEAPVLTMRRHHGSAVYVIYRNKQAEIVKNPHYRNFGCYVKISKDRLEKSLDISPKTPLIKQFLRKHERYHWFYTPHTFDWSDLYQC